MPAGKSKPPKRLGGNRAAAGRNQLPEASSPWLGGVPAAAMNRIEQFNAEVESAIGVTQLAEAIVGRRGGQPGRGESLSAGERAKSAGVGSVLAALGSLGAAAEATGLTGRIQNALRNERVMVHGTASPIKGGYVNPQIGSAARPTENVVYGWNPRHQGGNWIPNTVAEYAHKAPEGVVPNPRVLITKVPKRGSVVDPKNPGVVVSTKPARIVGEVPAKSIDTNYYEALNRELRKAGAPINNALKESKAAQKARNEYQRWLLRRSERNSTA